VRVGVIGVGRIGASHARVLAAHEGMSEVLVMDVDGGRADEVARVCKCNRSRQEHRPVRMEEMR
jgi:predicted dehydrogenase